MASVSVTISIDNLEEDTDMQEIADRAKLLLADHFRYCDVELVEWECQ